MSRPMSAAAPSAGGDLPLGSRVEVSAGAGIVRWTGVNPPFAAGKWVGVELLEPNGKNDGSVKDQQYFSCRANYGVFVRPSQVKLIRPPPSASSRPSSSASTSRPSMPTSATPRPLTRTVSSRSSASLAVDPSRSPSPVKPTRTATSTSLSSSTSRTPSATPLALRKAPSSTAPPARQPSLVAATANRLAMKRSVSTTSSLGGLSDIADGPPAGLAPARRPSSSQQSRPQSRGGVTSPPPVMPPQPSFAPAAADAARIPSPDVSTATTAEERDAILMPPPPPPVPAAAAAPAPVAPAAPVRDHGHEELKIKLRVLEAKRTEESERLRAVEAKLRDAEELARGGAVLQNKLQHLQSELSHLRLSSKHLETSNSSLETRLIELTDQLEMVTLDKEFAEEKGENLELELEQEKEKNVELEVEVEVLRGENAEFEKPPENVGERSSLAFVQLEKHNERLKEALIRLRDMTSEAERDQRNRISELERDLSETSGLQAQYELTQGQLENAELQVEDLKIQLDDALGAEEMLEALTEKNLAMGEKLEEMRIAIEDLEALKELNDELEENHVETEKQLQEEIDLRDLQHREQRQRAEGLEEALLDHQGTIGQFRDLVIGLQTELDQLREQQISQLSEAQNMSTQSQTMLNLNLKLQSSATKAQAKTIDLELKKLEATQAMEHLAIVQSYLPQAYFENDADSTNCLLFFDRLAYKTSLMNTIIAQTHSLPDSLYAAASDSLVATCEMRSKLSHFSLLNRRFAVFLKRCPVEAYLKTGGVYHELAGVEKRIDGHMELLRKDEFKETDCHEDLLKFVAQFEHLAEAYFGQTDLDLGERELDQVLGFDHDLDNFAAAVGYAKHMIVTASQDPELVVDLGSTSLDDAIYAPIQHILELVKSVKLASKKLVRRVEDLVRLSSALRPTLLPALRSLVDNVSNAVDFAIQLAQRIGGYSADIRASKEPLRLDTILGFLQEITADARQGTDLAPWDVVAGFVARLGQEAAVILPTMMEQEHVFKVVGTAPWLTRVEHLNASALVNVEAERKVVKLSEEVRDLVREMKKRDQASQESTVKIQMLEKRQEGFKAQSEAVTELEADLVKARRQETAYTEAMEQLRTELDEAATENARLKAIVPVERSADAPGAPSTSTGDHPGLAAGIGGGAATTESSFETSYLLEQIDSLRLALRYLRSENSFLKSQDLLSSLPPLLPHSYPLPPLSPSHSSASDSDSDDPPAPKTPPPRSLRAVQTEAKLLYREVARFRASPVVVDLTGLGPRPQGGDGMEKGEGDGAEVKKIMGGWKRRAMKPEQVVEQRRREGDRLGGLVEELRERVGRAEREGMGGRGGRGW